MKLSIKMRAKGWFKSGNLEMDLEAETLENMEKLVAIVKENFKMEVGL